MKRATYKQIIFFVSLIVMPSFLSAQEMWGIANSNYAGNMGMHLNPASMVGAPYKYEINLLAGDYFFDNNYLYVRNFTDLSEPLSMGKAGSAENKTLYSFNTSDPKHGYQSILLIGPSYILNKGNRAWAIQTHLRSVSSFNNFSPELAQAFSSNFGDASLYGVNFQNAQIKAATMTLGDISFSYGKSLIDNETQWLSVGATVRAILGFSGSYLKGDAGSYSIPDPHTLNIQNANFDYAFAPSNINRSSLSDLFPIRGVGGSFDLGAIYIKRRIPAAYKCDRDADKAKRYNYRLGVSLLDIGYVSYFSGAASYQVRNGSAIWNGVDSAKISSIPDFHQAISSQLPTTKVSDNFGMMMPAAASVQFDYCWKPSWYTNLSVVQRIPFTYKEVMRANQIALVPRYETRRFEASASINLYEYEHVDAGVALRWWVFVLGTDRLLSFFGSEVRTFDLFFGLRYNSCTMNSKKKKSGECPFD